MKQEDYNKLHKNIKKRFPSPNGAKRKIRVTKNLYSVNEGIDVMKSLVINEQYNTFIVDKRTFDKDIVLLYCRNQRNSIKTRKVERGMYIEIIADFENGTVNARFTRRFYGDERDYPKMPKNENNISKGLYRDVLFDNGDKNAFFPKRRR